MSKERELDVVVFGATGFTGYYILLELMRTSPQSGMGSKIGAAGRTLAKLEKVVSRAVHELSQEGIIFRAGAVELIKADVNDYDSLLEMSKRTKLVINAVGPYRKYGLPMVKACISAGTHHLDICGEPEFIEKVDLLYGGEDGLAAANKCYVVSAVGFDSVPCDLGVVHNQRVSEKKGLVPSSVESFLTVRTTGKNGESPSPIVTLAPLPSPLTPLPPPCSADQGSPPTTPRGSALSWVSTTPGTCARFARSSRSATPWRRTPLPLPSP